MTATEEQYAEAWCTHLLGEQQEVNEEMGRLLRDQQRTIDELHEKLKGNPQQLSARTHKYHGGHRLGPQSGAITWMGTIKDMVPISVDGKDYKALIMTEEMINALNDAFSSTTAFDMIKPQFEEEIKFQEKLEDLAQPTSNPDEIFPGGLPDAEVEDTLSASRWRTEVFRGIWNEEVKRHNNAYDYVEKYMWKVLKRNNLGVRKRDNFEELRDVILESKKAVLKGCADKEDLVRNLEVETPSYGSGVED